jgi:methyltransferase family protein
LSGKIKSWINGPLGCCNLQLASLTAQRRETRRLQKLADSGYFDRPVFPVPRAMADMDCTPVLTALRELLPRFADFANTAANDVDYRLDNGYFSSPDAEVLYAMLRLYKPGRIVEIGCGNSTKLSRQAIIDGGLSTRLTCIDPCPRTDVSRFADEIFSQPAEQLVEHEVFRTLSAGDVLFIDSSHELRPGNDCVALFLQVLPALPVGVLVHVHDVFLPYEYPCWWFFDEAMGGGEQYLVQAALMAGASFDVLWASHYLLRTDERLARLLPRAAMRYGSSLWLRKAALSNV